MSRDMAKVWDAWHSMPIPKNRTYDPDLRANCLLKGRLLSCNGKLGKKTEKLKETDRPLLEAAVVWVKIVGGIERVFGRSKSKSGKRVYHRLGHVQNQLIFKDYNLNEIEDVAIFRMTQELHASRKEFWKEESPDKDIVDLAERRRREYYQARCFAMKLYVPMVMPSVTGTVENKESVCREMAQLIALKIASPESISEFMSNMFLGLSKARKHAFIDAIHKPKPMPAYRYPLLPVWLADNIPVFNEYRCQWPDIFRLVKARFNRNAPQGCRDCPLDVEALKRVWRQALKKNDKNEAWTKDGQTDVILKQIMKDEAIPLGGNQIKLSPANGRPRKSRLIDFDDKLLTPLPHANQKKG